MAISQHKLELFISAYMAEPNAAKAAIKAGYSPNGAKVTGFHLLRRPEVQEEIMRRGQEMARTMQLDGEAVLRKVAELAMAPTVRGSHIPPSVQTRCLDMLGQHFKLWEGASGARVININVLEADMKTL